MATSVVNPRAQFFANNGRPLIGGRIHTYVAGSSTRARTYKDAAKAQPNTNPIILDGRGEAQIYLAEGVEYKFVFEDSKGALIYTQEPVYGAVWPNAADWPSDATLSYQYMTEAKAAAGAIGPIKFYDTYAQALGDISNLSNDDIVEISRDETLDFSRVRYKVLDGGFVSQLPLDWYSLGASGSVGRTISGRLRDTSSAADFGAIGDGGANESPALMASQSATGEANLVSGKQYNIGEGYAPEDDVDISVNGFGKIKWSSYLLGGYALRKDFLRESMYLTPDSWFQKTRIGSYVSPEYPPYAPPGRGGDLVNIFNTVLSWRSALGKPGVRGVNTTAYGANIGVTAEDWNLTDAFGADAGMFMRLSDRNTLLGTETAVWAGAPNREYMIQYGHDWYRNTPPNEWTDENTPLEANNPGIGAAIYNYENYPTAKEDVRFNVFTGRDAGCHFLRGEGNTAAGYSAGYNLFSGSNNSYYGGNAGRDNFFGNNNTFLGSRSGESGAWTRQSTYVGYGAGRRVSGIESNASANGVAIGYLAADNVKKLNNSVVIGPYAASGLSELNGKLFIGGTGNTTTPLIGGDFPNSRVAIAVPVGEERARLHVRSSAQGSAAARNGILIEGGLLNFETGAGGFAGAAVYTSGDVNAAGLQFGADSQSWQISIGGVNRWRVHPGDFRPASDNAYTLGTAAFRPTTIFAASGAINTSDAREKSDPLEISDALLDAWGEVQIFAWNWLKSISEKGDKARTHYGPIAQHIRDALVRHGLMELGSTDCRHGLLCYDEWGDVYQVVKAETIEHPAEYSTFLVGADGKPLILKDSWIEEVEPELKELVQQAGSRWGIRADQCLFLEAAYQRRARIIDHENLNDLIQRVNSLELKFT